MVLFPRLIDVSEEPVCYWLIFLNILSYGSNSDVQNWKLGELKMWKLESMKRCYNDKINHRKFIERTKDSKARQAEWNFDEVKTWQKCSNHQKVETLKIPNWKNVKKQTENVFLKHSKNQRCWKNIQYDTWAWTLKQCS